MSLFNTVWKYQDFCITQSSREINFEDSWSTKPAILRHVEALNLDCYEFFPFWRLQFTKWTKFLAPKMAKMAVFALLESTKLISHKISVIQKSWNFHTVLKDKTKYCVKTVTNISYTDKLSRQYEHWLWKGKDRPHWRQETPAHF